VSHSSKLYKSYKRLLTTQNARKVLRLIWKESALVRDQDLVVLGMARSFNGLPPTQHGLAVALAGHPSEVSKLNTLVRSIGIAGQAFELVDRKLESEKKVFLQGTELLHELMIALAEIKFEQLQGFELYEPLPLVGKV
jgi:hypothetical protein